MPSPLIQTAFFQAHETEESHHVFVNPIQMALLDRFPMSVSFTVLSVVLGAPKGELGLTHVVEFNGEDILSFKEILRFEHPPAAVLLEGAGVSFSLEVQNVNLDEPGTLVVKTKLSDGTWGRDVPLRVALNASKRP